MKALLALIVLAALSLAAPPIHADQAEARERLKKEGLAFTPEGLPARLKNSKKV
jgi:hypothetical protein